MKNYYEVYESVLNDEAIDECSLRVRSFLKQMKHSNSEIIRYSFSIEEILIKIRDTNPEQERHITLTLSKKLFRMVMELVVDGDAINTYLLENDDDSVIGNNMLKTLGLSPTYLYKNNKNIYSFIINKVRLNPFIKLIIAFACAYIIGLLGTILMDASTRMVAVDSILSPLHDTFLNMLGSVAGPMIFLSVAWGIYGIGDATTLKQIGSKLLGSYVSILFISSTILGAISIPLFKVEINAFGNSNSITSEIINMILGIIPKNIFSPFVDGNTLQIIFLGIMFGIGMLFLGRRADAIAQVVEQINLIVQFLIEIISVLVPYFIFLVLVEMMWTDSLGTIKQVGTLFLVFVTMAIALALYMIISTSINNKVKPTTLIIKQLPTLITGITTASSAACFASNIKSCEEKLGINEKITSFGLPLGMVAFKPTTSLNYISMAVFFAKMYNVNISLQWFIIMVFTACILAIATPPIPGGAASSYAVLFSQLGISPEAIAIALACDTIFDFVATGNDQFLMPFRLLNQASKFGMVDKKN